MNCKTFFRNLLPSVCLLALCCSCAAPVEKKQRLAMGIPDGRIKYKDVDTSNLELKLLSKPVVRAGEKAKLIFSVQNNGTRPVDIQEWLSHEPDNILLLVQPWLTEMKAPDKDRWTELTFDRKRPVLHYPMTLMPGNQALVAKELDFIQNLRVSPGCERRFFLKAVVNLKSVKLSSKVFALRVLPQQIMKAD